MLENNNMPMWQISARAMSNLLMRLLTESRVIMDEERRRLWCNNVVLQKIHFLIKDINTDGMWRRIPSGNVFYHNLRFIYKDGMFRYVEQSNRPVPSE